MRNGRPFFPRRSCENRIGLPLSILTASATIRKTGMRADAAMPVHKISRTRRKLTWGVGDGVKSCFAVLRVVMRRPQLETQHQVPPQGNARQARRLTEPFGDGEVV